MGKITDLNITGLDSDKHSALLGDAHEMIVAGILTRLGFEVGLITIEPCADYSTTGVLGIKHEME